jgi:hypothetical protein
MKKIKTYATGLFLILAGLLSSCIENNVPYPIIKLDITALEVEGETTGAVISTENRTVTVTLADTVNMKKVYIRKVEMTEGAKSILRPDTTFDLTNPQTVILSLYQDYPWKIIAKQPIDRRFVVEGQIGEAVFYVNEKERRAIAYVSKEQDLSKIKIKELKLGPTGSTIHGYDGNATVMNFAGGQPQIVIVTYRDILEDWTLNVFETDAVKITSADGWVNVVWLYGEGLEGEDNGFEIRETTSEEWQKVDASYMIATGGSFSARIPHLKASTAYVCRAYSGTSISTEKTFTTTAAIELPNASFDYWSMDGKVANPWEENSTPFWDTGNIGVTTASQSNSTPTDDTAAGSGKAARLESKNVIVKFAAGNLFTGKFIKVDGTNGILNFGQPFTGRPTKLKGYYKYTTAPITDLPAEGSQDYTRFQNYKGKPDTCAIYIALGDWTEPIEIRTRPTNRKLFDKNDEHIIAYAEMYSGTTVTEYKKFELNLDYRVTNRVPTYIVIVCSASKYGDYFVGGRGSTLHVDEFSLDYDY